VVLSSDCSKGILRDSGFVQQGAQPERGYNPVLFFQLSGPRPVSFTLYPQNLEPMMEVDDQGRGSSGVVCSLYETKEGRLRLVLDDVKNESGSNQGPWTHHVLFTFKDYDMKEVINLGFSESELAEFGFNIFARLIAQREHPIE
jgi:hypothetical protein